MAKKWVYGKNVTGVPKVPKPMKVVQNPLLALWALLLCGGAMEVETETLKPRVLFTNAGGGGEGGGWFRPQPQKKKRIVLITKKKKQEEVVLLMTQGPVRHC